MNFRDYMQKKSIAGTLSALTLAAGMFLSSGAMAGVPSVSFDSPLNGETIEFYTQGAVLPAAIPVPADVTSTTGATPDVASVKVDVDGANAKSASEESAGNWFTTVDLANATAAADGGFATTLNAIGRVPAYYTAAAYNTTASTVNLTVSILDSATVDTNPDGDPIPDDDQIVAILPADPDDTVTLVENGTGGSVVTTILEDLAGTGINIEASVALSGGRTAIVTVTGPAFVSGDYPDVAGANLAVAMITFANSAAELTGTGTPPSAVAVYQGVFFRLVILVSDDAGATFTSYTGALPTGFNVDIEIANATPITAASVYGFGLSRQIDGSFLPEASAAYTEINPIVLTRATVTGGVVSAAISGASTVVAVATTGGAATTGGGGSGSSSTCFIATAAYGTPMAAEIDTLRSVRDSYLLNNVVGSAFVDTYYRLSPAVADKVAASPVLAAVVRALLTPVVLLGQLILAAPMVLVGLMLAGAGLVLAHRKARA